MTLPVLPLRRQLLDIPVDQLGLLEAVSECGEASVAEDRAGEGEERLVDVGAAFVAGP